MKLKSKKIFGWGCLFLAFILLLIPMPVVTAANGINDFKMNESTLAKYDGTAMVVSIPDNVKVVGEEAFARNSDIGVVTVGEDVKEISFSAFAGCNYLTTVKLNENLETLGDYVFSGCSYLSKINIGPHLKNFGTGVFAGCNALKEIVIDENNSYLYYAKGALYDIDKECLYGYLNGFPSLSYRMPDTVTEIAPYSFWGNQHLESIQLSSYLQEIPGYAFSNCKSLRKISIPYSVNYIDAKAFENCISLTEVEIPPSVSFIDPTAFDGCLHLNIIAEKGTVAYDFYENYKKKLETVEVDETEENPNVDLPGLEEESDVSTENNVSNSYIDASKDPSNVEYMPDRDVLEIPEKEDVKAKTLIVGGSATLFMDNKGVTVHSGADGIKKSQLNVEKEEKKDELKTEAEKTEAEKTVTDNSLEKETDEEKTVTVVGSIGSVLPQYVSDTINDEKIGMVNSTDKNRDKSPDTGDYSIPVNYFLAVGLAAVGMIVLLKYNEKR